MEAQKQDRMRISFIISLIISLGLLGWWVAVNIAMLSAIILPTQNFLSTTQTPLSDAANLNVQGMALLKLGKYSESIGFFDKALSLINPESFDALYNKGIALANLGKYNESIVYFDKALAINPNSFNALYNKGAALANLGKYNESIVYFDKALAINPNSFNALYNKGAALANLGKYNESIVYFDKALAINPHNVKALNLKKFALESSHKINIMNKGVNVIQPKNLTQSNNTNSLSASRSNSKVSIPHVSI